MGDQLIGQSFARAEFRTDLLAHHLMLCIGESAVVSAMATIKMVAAMRGSSTSRI